MDIHPSAWIDPKASISEGCVVGPLCVVGPDVVLERNVTLKSHVVVDGDTHIGEGTTVFSFAVLGEIPQDKKFQGEHTKLRIGRRNRIREHVTVNTGTEGGGGVTRIGDDGLFMAGAHIAHDAVIGDRVIVVNSSAIAGHCVLEDDVIVGGLCGVHQFVRIGQGAMVGALSMVSADVAPYGMVMGARGALEGLNLVGLKRSGASRADMQALRRDFELLMSRDGTLKDRLAAPRQGENQYTQALRAFLMGESDRGFLMRG